MDAKTKSTKKCLDIKDVGEALLSLHYHSDTFFVGMFSETLKHPEEKTKWGNVGT